MSLVQIITSLVKKLTVTPVKLPDNLENTVEIRLDLVDGL